MLLLTLLAMLLLAVICLLFFLSPLFGFIAVFLLLFAAIAMVLAFYALRIWLFISMLSVAYSRLAMAMLIATGTGSIAGFSYDLKLFENGWLNFLAGTAIVFCVISIISMLPRVAPAVGTFCTFMIALIVTLITMGIGLAIFSLFVPELKDAGSSLWFNIAVAVVAIFLTAVNWLIDIDSYKDSQGPGKILSMPIFVRIGRVIASVIYGFVLTCLLDVALTNVIPDGSLVVYVIWGACAVVAYVADLFLFDRAAPPRKKKTTTALVAE